MIRIEARRGLESHGRGVCGGMGQGGGVGVRRLLGVGEGRGLSDLEQKIAFRFLGNLPHFYAQT